jgi:hypothetical protein
VSAAAGAVRLPGLGVPKASRLSSLAQVGWRFGLSMADLLIRAPKSGFCTPKSPASKPGRGRVQRSVSLAVSTTHALFAEEVQSNMGLNSHHEPRCGVHLGGEHVRFRKQSGHHQSARQCPLMTLSGRSTRHNGERCRVPKHVTAYLLPLESPAPSLRWRPTSPPLCGRMHRRVRGRGPCDRRCP